MLRGLDRELYEPIVLCPSDGDLRQMVEAEGVYCRLLPELNARFTKRPAQLIRYVASLLGVMSVLRREIQRNDPDFIHANTLRAGIAATIATIGTGRRIIWHVHDDLPHHPLSGVIRRLAFTSRRTHVIAVSQATAEAFRGTLDFGARLRVIHNGTDLSRFPLKSYDENPLKDELGIPQDSFLVCAVGQICARKGLVELVQAFSLAVQHSSKLHLAIVGKTVFAHEAPYHDALVRSVESAGLSHRVHFTGACSDIASVLQSADLLVLNSLEEPFGLVLVEAMSCGTPVLAARVGGIPEIVTDNVTGWLVERGNTRELAAKLLLLSQQSELLSRVAITARKTVCPKYSVERFSTKLHSYYTEFSYSSLSHSSREQQKVTTPLLPAHHEEGDQFV
jgi:glycosyltransferase involved in cell wall biosynthesis